MEQEPPDGLEIHDEVQEMTPEEIERLQEAIEATKEKMEAVRAGALTSQEIVVGVDPAQGKRFEAKAWGIPGLSGRYAWSVVDTETGRIRADFYTPNEDPEALAREFADRLNTEEQIKSYTVMLRKLLDVAMGMPRPPAETEEDDEEDGMAHLAGCPACYAGHDCHDHAEEGEG